MAPGHDDPQTQMGVQIFTAELRMERTILIEVEGATLQDLLQDMVTLEEKQNKNRPPTTERQEIGNQPCTRRAPMFNYLVNWIARPIFKEESIRANRFHEPAPDEVDRMEHRIHYVLRCGKPSNKKDTRKIYHRHRPIIKRQPKWTHPVIISKCAQSTRLIYPPRITRQKMYISANTGGSLHHTTNQTPPMGQNRIRRRALPFSNAKMIVSAEKTDHQLRPGGAKRSLDGRQRYPSRHFPSTRGAPKEITA